MIPGNPFLDALEMIFPVFIEPMQCKPSRRCQTDERWSFEIKFAY